MRDPKLRSLYNQMANAYKATINAIENDDHKQAVTLQLSAIDSLNKFNEAVLKDIEHVRKGGPPKQWAR